MSLTPVSRPAKRGRRRLGLMIGVLLALGVGIQQLPFGQLTSPATSTVAGSASGSTQDPLTAPAQSALNQILGPDHAIVTASAVYLQPSSRISTTYDPKHVAVLNQSVQSGSGLQSSVRNNGVSSSVTHAVVPSGQIGRLMVTVVVDSTLRPAPKLTTVRRVVSAAMGLQPSRGDRLWVQTAALPAVGALAASTTTTAPGSGAVPAWIAPDLNSVLAGMVALALLLALSLETLRRKR